MSLPELFACAPAVYAVEHEYQIFIPVTRESVMWVQVGDECFYDDSNGVMRSDTPTHKMTVPMELLDAEKKYTVCWRIVYARKPYFSELSGICSAEFNFRPVTGPDIRIYQIADSHNHVTGPVAAGKYFGDKLDLLLLNGDVPEDSGKIENFRTIHEIAGQITNGEIPIIYSRGNHDCRGIYAEHLAEHTACSNGKFYYTFRIGPLWGILLDCGEDKLDTCESYGLGGGGTICCHDFRLRETRFLKNVIAHADTEYNAPGVIYRVVMSHVPFPQTLKNEFRIEEDTYTEWCDLLRDHVKPHVMISGHIHNTYVIFPDGEHDDKHTPCPVIVASKMKYDEPGYHVGGAITLTPERILVEFTDQDKVVSGSECWPLNNYGK